MAETVQVKLEADREGFSTAPSNHNQIMASHVTPTSNNDGVSAAVAVASIDSFLDRIHFVKLKEKDEEGNVVDTKLWPALWFSCKQDLYDAVGSWGAKIKIARFFKQQENKGHKFNHGYGIAYLLGMQTIEESIIALSEHMVESFDERIDELLKKDEYKNNPKFQAAVKIVFNQSVDVCASNEEGDQVDESQSQGTVALDFDTTISSPSSNNQASAEEVITIEDTPENSGGKDKKRKKGGKNDGAASKKKKNSKQAKPHGSQRQTVTPLPAKSGDKDIAQHLRDTWSTSHRVIKHDDALKLLKEKFGVKCEDGKFYLPGSVDTKPVASSLMGLRKDLCEKGLPESTQPLSREEKIDINRWVRYAHVKGLEDGQEINPDDLGEKITKFMDAWSVLRDNFGCSYSNDIYKVPLTPDGNQVHVFQGTREVDRHFARFGIPCIPNDPGDRLSQKDRLSIELFFSTPRSLEVLNTFDRIDDNVNNKRKRRRRAVSYRQ
ncbi:hypothetical protein ACHAWT_004439 [Skeletonema menzelii]